MHLNIMFPVAAKKNMFYILAAVSFFNIVLFNPFCRGLSGKVLYSRQKPGTEGPRVRASPASLHCVLE